MYIENLDVRIGGKVLAQLRDIHLQVALLQTVLVVPDLLKCLVFFQ